MRKIEADSVRWHREHFKEEVAIAMVSMSKDIHSGISDDIPLQAIIDEGYSGLADEHGDGIPSRNRLLLETLFENETDP